MATRTKVPQSDITVEQFLEAYSGNRNGKYELEDGQVIKMAAETVRHSLLKSNIGFALRSAVSKANLSCAVHIDGASVKTGPKSSRVPDVALQCTKQENIDSTHLDSPLIVVEVVSPSSDFRDTYPKFVEYFSVASIMHYVIISPKSRIILHHQRSSTDKILTTIVRSGTIEFAPPGISISFNDIFGEVDR